MCRQPQHSILLLLDRCRNWRRVRVQQRCELSSSVRVCWPTAASGSISARRGAMAADQLFAVASEWQTETSRLHCRPSLSQALERSGIEARQRLADAERQVTAVLSLSTAAATPATPIYHLLFHLRLQSDLHSWQRRRLGRRRLGRMQGGCATEAERCRGRGSLQGIVETLRG